MTLTISHALWPALLYGSVATGPTVRAAVPSDTAFYRLEDTVALGAFLDGVMKAHIEHFRMPAAAVVVVQGQRVLYARGYGHADLEAGKPVDPATSMFHIGSTGKLFTWTAVMQLVEQGRLDLDTDVNRYLETFQIPPTYPEPVTLRHLLTHTAGFQEGLLGYFIGTDSTNIRTIDETLRWHVPARVRPPGRLASYSNYGASLAGLIVEQASGEPFAEYVERHIYQPLGIRYATFREPIPAELRPHAVIGYQRQDGGFVRQPFEINGGFTPSGGTVMSTLDMARFMIAHLNDGRYGGARILEPETAALMHRTAFTHDPRMPGVALGFIESTFNGRRVIGHDGDSKDFHVGMLLFPEAKVGIYSAYGAEGGDVAREQLARAFFDRYFPATAVAAPSAAGSAVDLDRYAGDYRIIRMNYTDIDKFIWFGLAPTQATVTVMPGGRLLLVKPSPSGDESIPLVPDGGHLFREVGGDRLVRFAVDSSGRVSHLFADPTTDYERVPWTERTGFWFPILAGAFLVFLGTLAGWYYRRREIRAMTMPERRAARLSVLAVGWLLLTLVVLAAVIGAYRETLFERIPMALRAALIMPLIFVGLAIALVGSAITAWRGRYWTAGRRVHYTLVALAAAAVSWFLYQWNILGWQFG